MSDVLPHIDNLFVSSSYHHEEVRNDKDKEIQVIKYSDPIQN
jgi:hypothetical protein